jgi:peptidoglycan/LPS O-acetylase OafA/YrhL
MTALAFAAIARGRNLDRTLGDLTYPLYLYHEVVLIVILTVTTEYAYSTLAVGFVLSFVTAGVLMALVDPAVTAYRDRVRGRTLRLPQVNVDSGVEPSQPATIPLLDRTIQAPGSLARS